MSPQAPPQLSKPAKSDQDVAEEPNGEDFWERFSPQFEFPLANVASVVIHIIVFGLFMFYISRLLKTEEKTPPSIHGATVVDSDGPAGLGSAGSGSASGGPSQAEASYSEAATPDRAQPLSEPQRLKALAAVSSWSPELADNPEALEAIADSPNASKLGKLGDDLRNRLAGLGKKKGEGKQEGSNNSGQKGTGSGGIGDATSSQRRSGRWILIFRTENGRDYVSQLGSLQAQIVVRKPNGKFIHFPDLKDLDNRKEINEEQIPSELMNFIDENPESTAKVAKALGLDFVPPEFIALVPKDVENDLAAKERAFRNRAEDRIYSTTFRVLVRDGKYTVTVTDQVEKKKK